MFPQCFWCGILGAKLAQAQAVMTLGQPPTLLVSHQFTVEELRHRPAQCPINQDLARRAGQEVGSPHNLGDAHQGIIHRTRQLIGWNIIGPPHHKITKIPPCHKGLISEI